MRIFRKPAIKTIKQFQKAGERNDKSSFRKSGSRSGKRFGMEKDYKNCLMTNFYNREFAQKRREFLLAQDKIWNFARVPQRKTLRDGG